MLVFGYIDDDSRSYEKVYSNLAVTSARRLNGLNHLPASAPSPSVDHWPTINLDSHPLDLARTARETEKPNLYSGTRRLYLSRIDYSDYLRARTPATEPGPMALHGGPAPDRPGTPLTHLATIQLPQGSHTILEFNSFSSHFSFLSTTHIVCMVPFLACCISHRLSDVLATANGTRLFKSSTLTNTSAAYAETLVALSTTLTYDLVARKQCVEELGIKGWRKQRLMPEFEAALVRRGWLECWNVVLEAR